MTNLSKNGAYRSEDVWLPGVEVPLRLVLTPENDYLIEQQQIAFAGGKKSEKSVRYLLKQSKPFNDRMKNAITSGQIQAGQGCDTSEVVKVDHNKGVSRLYTIQTAVLVWQHWAEDGSDRCRAIVTALAVEALERRADSVFGIQRTQAEVDERFEKTLNFVEGVHYKRFRDGVTHMRSCAAEEVLKHIDQFTDEDLLLAGVPPHQVATRSFPPASMDAIVEYLELIDGFNPELDAVIRDNREEIESEAVTLDELLERVDMIRVWRFSMA